MRHLIKANLTYDEKSYELGVGEGCWLFVEDDCKLAYDRDDAEGEYVGILDNDSCYFEGLSCGEELPVEMRGEGRPVVPYRYLTARFKRA